ncbi:acid protease [Hygrophoropsis aurantiaca]|uniref:Acid protease n=1 Tax=Hygrophoropsis aurantiaca TaxID=72124 RepID=A0ACB8AIT5_9AGAM|nr:acid protease [Hygrophoropsis aurantiaca]
MLSTNILLSLLAVLSSTNAHSLKRDSGKTTLRLATKFNTLGVNNIAEADRARAQQLRQAATATKRDGTSVAINDNSVNYVASVGVGEPATNYSLIVDTGSANTWVGASQIYQQTASSADTGNSIKVSYGSGNFTGEEWTDTVTLGSLKIQKQSIGVASQASGFDKGIDGILGVGPADLTDGTVSNTDEVPTVTDNLLSQGSISANVLGVYFIPASTPTKYGDLTFGGVNSGAITGEIGYVPITSTSPANKYWGVDQSVTYGSQTILSLTAGIVDTGTTLILLATDAYDAYVAATGAVADQATGLLKITPAQYGALSPLTMNIGGQKYPLSPNAQIWPRALNTDIGGQTDAIYLIVADMKSKSGSGLDFINGYAFLERYYTVYDTTNLRVGFAETAYTDADTN